MCPRSLSAVAHRVASKPRFAPVPLLRVFGLLSPASYNARFFCHVVLYTFPAVS